MSKLMIVESPNKIKKIEAALKSIGGSWRVEASVGHIRDLDDEMKEGDVVCGVESTLRPRYTPTERGRSVIAKLRKSIAVADKVYLATDPDREGEAISWHLMQALGLKPNDYVRVAFNEVTKQAIAKALKQERSIDNRWVAAQEARRVLDRLVGFSVSPLVSNLLNAKASAGRVQSPAVGLVVERERAIRNFKPVDHYSVRGSCSSNTSTCTRCLTNKQKIGIACMQSHRDVFTSQITNRCQILSHLLTFCFLSLSGTTFC